MRAGLFGRRRIGQVAGQTWIQAQYRAIAGQDIDAAVSARAKGNYVAG